MKRVRMGQVYKILEAYEEFCSRAENSVWFIWSQVWREFCEYLENSTASVVYHVNQSHLSNYRAVLHSIIQLFHAYLRSLTHLSSCIYSHSHIYPAVSIFLFHNVFDITPKFISINTFLHEPNL